MRELGSLYKTYCGSKCEDRALDYMLYVVEKEKKYPIEHLLKSVQEHTEKRLGFYFYDSMRYMNDTYMYFFFYQSVFGDEGKSIQENLNEKIYQKFLDDRKPCESRFEQFAW
jgi:endo-beta-N-acetylglucosaminidase D